MNNNNRQDKDLAFMLQYENVAWYENGTVRILDRRVYPQKIRFVICNSHQEVARAITDMVTQSGGPYVAAAMGMALAAHECRNKSQNEQKSYLQAAAKTISHARPTTAAAMERVCAGCLQAAETAFDEDKNVCDAIFDHAVNSNERRYRKYDKVADHLVRMFPQNGSVMTQCFGEVIVGQMLKKSRQQGKHIRLFCPETRPYFQGARLTATVARDMGFDVTVITDNMPAYVMQKEKIDVFTSAADAICLDGHIVNKVGTFQIAIAAKYMGIPYFVTGSPDPAHPTVNSVEIEMRDPAFVLQAMGIPTTCPGVKGYYPAFDITPPHLVSGVVTEKGIFAPYDLKAFFYDSFN